VVCISTKRRSKKTSKGTQNRLIIATLDPVGKKENPKLALGR